MLTNIDKQRMADSIRSARKELERKARFYCYDESDEHAAVREFLLRKEKELRDSTQED